MKLSVQVSALSALLVSFSTAANSDESYPFVMEGLPSHLEYRVNAQASALQVTFTDDYFIAPLKVWDTSQPIKVCFFGGSQNLRSQIAQVAMQWTTVGGYLPLDFGNIAAPRSCGAEFVHIRVGFQYKGYWSTVGTDSINLASQAEQSMNFALYDVNPPPEPIFSRVVLHEFGHALGLQHEHQSYLAPCMNEFDWNSIYTYLKGPPNYWSIEQIDHNLKPLPDDGQNDAGDAFDVKSIMLYSFPKNFYKPAADTTKCFTEGNNILSAGDVKAIVKYYPSNVADAQTIRSAALADYNQVVDKLNISDLEKSLAKLNASRVTSNAASINEGLVTFDWIRQLPGGGEATVQLPFDQLQSLEKNQDF
jgi:hypothetical protein